MNIFYRPGIRKYFKFITLSVFVGKARLDALIYQKAIEETYVKPGEYHFIDDQKENVDGIRKVGVQVQYLDRNSGEDLDSVLSDYMLGGFIVDYLNG